MANSIRLAVSQHFHNKENHAPLKDGSNRWAYGAFNSVDMAVPALVKHITGGKAICVASLKSNWRKDENFLSAAIMGVDFDHDVSVQQLLEDEFIARYALLVYATPSSTPDNPRSRALFRIDSAINDSKEYTRLTKRLLYAFSRRYPGVDTACKDGVRIFYGSDKPGWIADEAATLPVATLVDLPPHPDELPKPPAPPVKPIDWSNEREAKRAERYTTVALDNIFARLTTTGEGGRHAEIVATATQLAGMQKGGWKIDGWESQLRSVAMGLLPSSRHSEIDEAISWAYKNAEPKPFSLPENIVQHNIPTNGHTAPPAVNGGEPPPETPAAPPPNKKSITWRTSDESMQRYKERLWAGSGDSRAPLVFPFRALWEFGGFCRALPVGKMVGVVGLSGGMKTSFLETLTDVWRQMDANHVLWWGSEWTWEQMADRSVQRYGTHANPTATITDMSLHEMWLAEEDNGVPVEKRFGVKMPSHLYFNSRDVASKIEQWPGKNHYVEQLDLDCEELLDAMRDHVREMDGQGVPLRVAVFDYLQLLEMKSVRSETERINGVLGRIKAFIVDFKLIGIVASQVTKATGREVREGDDTLDAEAGQFMRSDKFNLVLTLNPVYAGDSLTDNGVIRVAKNSGGKPGKKTVYIDPSRFRWIDKAVEGLNGK